MSRYAFHHASDPSFADVMSKLGSCKSESGCDQSSDLSAIQDLVDRASRVPRFADIDPAKLPFSRDVVLGLVGQVQFDSAEDRQRAVAACRSALKQLDLMHPPTWAPLNPEVEALQRLLPKNYRRKHLDRLLLFASTAGIDLQHLNDAAMAEFRRQLSLDPSVAHPDQIWLQAARALNWASAKVPGLTCPRLFGPGII